MVRSFSLVHRHPLASLTCAGVLVGAIITGWVLAHRVVLVPVSGRVTVDGKPLQSGHVTFYPNPSRGNTHLWSAAGEIKDGKYELWTRGDKGVTKRGVPPGWYRVVVFGFAISDRGWADYFDCYDKPQTLEVSKTLSEDTYDLALVRPRPRGNARRR